MSDNNMNGNEQNGIENIKLDDPQLQADPKLVSPEKCERTGVFSKLRSILANQPVIPIGTTFIGMAIAANAYVLNSSTAKPKPTANVLTNIIGGANRPINKEGTNNVPTQITLVEKETGKKTVFPVLDVPHVNGHVYFMAQWLNAVGFDCITDIDAEAVVLRNPATDQMVAFGVNLKKAYIVKSRMPWYVDAWWKTYCKTGQEMIVPDMTAEVITCPPIIKEDQIMLPIRCIAAGLGSDPDTDIHPEIPSSPCTKENPFKVTIVLHHPVTIKLLQSHKGLSHKMALPPTLRAALTSKPQ